MGMFDWVDASAFEFPFETLDRNLYQTKDFERLMDTLVFNVDGTITRVYDTMEEVPDEERPYYGTPEWDIGGLHKMIGCKETVTEPLALPERETYHFYNSLKEDYKNTWVDVYADLENHKVVQFRWETKRFENGAENIIARGVVYVNKKDTEDEASA